MDVGGRRKEGREREKGKRGIRERSAEKRSSGGMIEGSAPPRVLGGRAT